ncbi:YecR family lipoprotein [Halocynthiibacter styelae]|uniref:Lipoprotein n=1 Tax=Halocynthiibacter styelae TaxID=2761955 RepID=A0A8J7IUJ8_9RHOB|nr:hypothetical protein [Paenihalocynthiibacter styelae]
MKYITKASLLSLIGLTLVSCATPVEKTPLPIGGSRADGSVVLGYQHSWIEVPTVDWAAASVSATRRCQAWGYRSADPFEGIRTQCERSDVYGTCLETTVSKTYQCLN